MSLTFTTKPHFLRAAPEALQDLHDDLAVLTDRAFDLDEPSTGDALAEALAILKRGLANRRTAAARRDGTARRYEDEDERIDRAISVALRGTVS